MEVQGSYMLAMSEPSGKKRRLEEAETTTQEPLTRSSIWFDDGNIIFQAEKTQFRVHKSILSRHSSVFKDMFSLPQPSEDVARQDQGDDNVPVVHIYDSPTDLMHLFSVLYNEPGYNSLAMPKLPFLTMASLLRLATKYDIPHIREEPLSRLEKMFPTSLQEFDALPDIENYLVSNADEGGILFDAVNLLHSERILHLLPMVYYLVCIQPIETVMYGQKRADGTLATLLPEVQVLCVVRRERLMLVQAYVAYSWVHIGKPISVNCTRVHECAALSTALVAKLFYPKPDIKRLLKPLVDATSHAIHRQYCGTCRIMAGQRSQDCRKQVWEQLPGVFGLPPWNQLAEAEDEDNV